MDLNVCSQVGVCAKQEHFLGSNKPKEVEMEWWAKQVVRCLKFLKKVIWFLLCVRLFLSLFSLFLIKAQS